MRLKDNKLIRIPFEPKGAIPATKERNAEVRSLEGSELTRGWYPSLGTARPAILRYTGM